jgi:hypothetical protein
MNDGAGGQDMGFSRRRPLTDYGAFVGGVGRSRSEGGVFSTTKALRLEYGKLKQRVEAAAKGRPWLRNCRMQEYDASV